MYWVGGQSSSLPSMQHTVLPLFLLPVSYAAGDEYSQWNIPGTLIVSVKKKNARKATHWSIKVDVSSGSHLRVT